MKNFGQIMPRECSLLSSSALCAIAHWGGRSSIPETAVIEPIGRSVLDTPHTRGMTIDRVRDGLRRYARNDSLSQQ